MCPRGNKKWCYVLICFLQEVKETHRRDGREMERATCKKEGFLVFLYFIFFASVRIMKNFSSHHFILHKQPFHQMCLTKPLKQPRMPLTRQAGDRQVSQTTLNTSLLFQAPSEVLLLPNAQRCPIAGNNLCCPKQRWEALVFLVWLLV